MSPLVSDFFLTLAQVAIGFVAFSTIAVVLRQMIGTSFDAYQTLLLHFVIECGLAATLYALAPVLLAIAGLTPPMLWRVSSAALGVFGLVFPVYYVRQRRRILPGPIPARAVWITLGTVVVDALLWLNALTPVFRWSAGPYAIGVTWLLSAAGIILILTFGEFMRREKRGD
jgi:hypothetical protein